METTAGCSCTSRRLRSQEGGITPMQAALEATVGTHESEQILLNVQYQSRDKA